MKATTATSTFSGIFHKSTIALVMASVLTACGESAPPPSPSDDPLPPAMPKADPLQAMLSGHVRDAHGQGIAGARVSIAETDASATTDAAGAYLLDVPADSTVTVLAAAAGFARTYRESVMVAAGVAVPDFDVMLLSPDALTSMNALGGGAAATSLGVMALRLHSLSADCVTAGARVAVWPPKAATVVYSRRGADGVDQPDPAADSVQDGVAIHAWLAGAVPPGNMLQLTVEQPGCQVMPQSPSIGGLIFPGLRRAEAQALTEADLFLGRALQETP